MRARQTDRDTQRDKHTEAQRQRVRMQKAFKSSVTIVIGGCIERGTERYGRRGGRGNKRERERETDRQRQRQRQRDPSIYTLVAKGAATIALYKVFPRLAVVRSQARDHNAFLYLSTCMICIYIGIYMHYLQRSSIHAVS